MKPSMSGLRNSIWLYKSKGLFVTGEPVRMRRIAAPRPTEQMALVLLACLFLMVVDSSTVIKTLNFFTKNSATSTPFFVENASMFISRNFIFPVLS